MCGNKTDTGFSHGMPLRHISTSIIIQTGVTNKTLPTCFKNHPFATLALILLKVYTVVKISTAYVP